jgi:hypothetical protein
MDSVTRWIFFFEGLNILISIFCVGADGFQNLSKALHCPTQLFICFFKIINFENAYTETLLRIPFTVIGHWSMISSADLSLAAGIMGKN